jgi:hypothetical protein
LRAASNLALTVLLAAPIASCQAAGTAVTNVNGIDIAEGINQIQRFAPDGRQALIVEGRQSGPASAPVFLVMLPRSTPVPGWDVVGIADGSGHVQTGPNTAQQGTARARSVRFARAKVGGLPATVMFVATQTADPGRYAITTFRLVTDGEDGSGLSAVFDPIRTVTPDRSFCSPDEALELLEDLDPEPGSGCPRA